jgi:peroxiredoxin
MPLAIGDKPQPFTLPAASGKEVSVAFKGVPATVVIWTCNHCPYALAWHDRIQAVIRDYRQKGVEFVQINANDSDKYPDDSFEKMQERLSLFESEYLRDEDQQFSKLWGAKVTPDVFIFDGAGALAYRGAPDSNYEDESENANYIRDALEDILAGNPVRNPETKVKGCSVKWIVNDQPNPYI